MFWIDWLRVIATFSVILLHVSSPILPEFQRINDSTWWIGNIVDGSVRFCVPVFLIISGALLLTKEYSSSTEFLIKRVNRIFLPFTFWSIIYISKSFILNTFFSGTEENVPILNFIYIQIINHHNSHFWYIYLIVGLYLLFPILYKWLNNSNQNDIKYFLIIWFLIITMEYTVVYKVIKNFELRYFSGFIGYPILGFYLYKFDFFSDRYKKKAPIFLLLIGILITIFGTYYLSQRDGKFNNFFYSYTSPNVMLTSIGIFLFFKNYNFRFINNKRIKPIIFYFSKYSYGIYLIHILILGFLARIGISYYFIHPIIGIFITSLICMLISGFTVSIINKLPSGKYVSG